MTIQVLAKNYINSHGDIPASEPVKFDIVAKQFNYNDNIPLRYAYGYAYDDMQYYMSETYNHNFNYLGYMIYSITITD